MIDENVTTDTQPDGLEAAEILFGDTVGSAAAADADAEECMAEESQHSQGSDADEEPVAGDEPQEELKVVLSLKGNRATIGVQRPSADPHIESFDVQELSELVHEVTAVTERARDRWEEQPKHPAYERPAPPARRRGRRQQEPAQAATAEEESEQEQPETLRLF